MDLSRIITTALIAMLVPLILRGIVARRGGSIPGELRYSGFLRKLSLGMATVPPLLVSAIVTFQDRPLRSDEKPAVALLIGLFPLIASPLLLEVFRVRHSYDDEGFDFRSPWSRHRRLRWSEVASIRWRQHLKWLDIKTSGGAIAHISPLLGGLDGFAQVALARIAPEMLEEAPDAKAVLDLMRQNAAGPLLNSPVSPQALLAEIEPERARPSPKKSSD